MSFKSTLIAATALVASASAHITMKAPIPYSVDTLDKGPISASQFPCKSNLGFTVSTVTKMAVGQSQPLQFSGSAVHNGGLCQLSVALTRTPTADTTFKVIKTIEGGCPGLDSQVKDFDFTLPDSIPDGDATFAWTWMPVSSGGPEYYMNCAPISVSGGASDDSKFKSLPDMLVANLPGKSDCTQVANTVLKAPNPGSVLVNGGGNAEAKAPTGSCGASGNQPTPEQPTPEQPTTPEQPASSSVATPSPTPTPNTPTTPTNPGGVFAPGASSGASAPTPTPSTLVPVPAPSAPVNAAPPAAPSAGTPSTGSPSQGTSCSTDGAVVCNGDSQFGLCNHGQVVWQDVAAGTVCSNGVISKRGYNGRIARPRAIRPYL